jgi:hypothetical protein
MLRETPDVVGHPLMAIWSLTKNIMGAGLHEKLNTLIFKKINVVGWKYSSPDWMKLNVDGCNMNNQV